MSSATRWRAELLAWAIPDHLLAAVPDCPYSWSPKLWQRRSAVSRDHRSETTRILRRLLGSGGTLLDIGAGTGGASLAIAAEGHRLTAVERHAGMVAGLRTEAKQLGLSIEVVEGSWPEVAERVPVHDVVLCAHVVYDVADLEPFLQTMQSWARRKVLVELTDRHPWVNLGHYYRVLHGLERPAGPTAELFIEVVAEVVGRRPQVRRWARPSRLWFTGWEEILEFYGRRLVLPQGRWEELRQLLEPEVAEHGGRFFVGGGDRRLVTVWW